ncbi:hypothetical protein GCM10011321_02210 [Youhaiella tibetensis]|uniref:SH3 domain-containing protein n=1 Tax=Paradevosia tibetensis TaxID=1447062 RepID=A0A5B9DR20_9HYPH|nr:SH3 domain-containing protein [Youhaiella tibetensis]AKR56523.1 hypothetical protein XM25_12097 [Devosia sp. H5989]QEE21566.1 SH3 domain-containing protein [Youhaiella tibetensis]GGF13812.1 hypothetical protein GCM10011321_02210 [Youhaiella tibetensis]
MKRQTAKLLRTALAGLAIAAAGVFTLLPSVASAAPATATSNVNVRSTPGGAVVGVLGSGERVDMQQCQGSWCYIEGRNLSGWVSSNYLSTGRGGGGPQVIGPANPNPNFGISVGPGGVSIGIGQPPVRPIPPRPGPRPPAPRPSFGEVCFYENPGMRGRSFCAESGDRIAQLGRWDSMIGSIENSDGLQVRVCTRPNFRGDCRVYTTDAFNLGRFDGSISSIQVY